MLSLTLKSGARIGAAALIIVTLGVSSPTSGVAGDTAGGPTQEWPVRALARYVGEIGAPGTHDDPAPDGHPSRDPAPRICTNPLYSVQAGSEPLTPEGYPVSQDWLLNAAAQARLEDFHRTIEPYAAAAGVVPDHPNQTFIVVVEPGTDQWTVEELRTALSDLALPFDTDIRTACRSTGALTTIPSQMVDLATSELAGVDFATVVDVAEGVVRVIVTDPAAEDVLRRHFGDDVRVELVDEGPQLAGSRNADDSPHYGDAQIWHDGWQLAT